MGYFPGRRKGGSRTAPTEFANIIAWAKKILSLQVALSYLLLLFSTSAGAATLKFEYDQAGNMISGQGRYYEYNDANQLVKVRKDAPSGPVIAEYVYDYQGQRVKKIENGITTYYIGKHYEERKGNTVNEKTNYIFVNGQRVAASIKKDNGLARVSYYLNNHLGSADVIVDEKGSVTDKVRYYPYGEYRTQPNAQRHTYTGKERDEATEQYYYEARYYNPFIRRFTQADTVTPNLYDPQSLNRYAYARNNPNVYNDPSGHIFDIILDIAFIANDIATLVNDPSQRTVVNYIALGADIVGAVVPGATGLGAGVKTAAGIVSKGAGIASTVSDFISSDMKSEDALMAAGSITFSLVGGNGSSRKNNLAAIEGSKIEKIGGRNPINSKYAGGIHPSGVKFNANGFPDFSPYSKVEMKYGNLTGNYKKDAAVANKSMGYSKTPAGYVWHHVEDGKTMQLIPSSIHDECRHTGGAAFLRNR